MFSSSSSSWPPICLDFTLDAVSREDSLINGRERLENSEQGIKFRVGIVDRTEAHSKIERARLQEEVFA